MAAEARPTERPQRAVRSSRAAGKTPAFRGPRGEALPGSVADVAYRRIGGVDQWVMVRGTSTANPVLVLLHGGPGLSETGLFRHYNAPLERRFTVVYWDQRGAGKSFDPAIARASMTVEQFVQDLDELVDTLCAELGTTNVTIFGHSWGSALGLLYAARFPGKVAAFVGSGQVGDAAAGERASYAFALAAAEQRGKRRLLEQLRAIGPPPHTAEEVFAERAILARLEGGMRPRALWKIARPLLHRGEPSVLDLRKSMRGFRFSLGAMWAETSYLDLHELVPALSVPAFFFLGRQDHWVPAETSVAYVEALVAPSKRVVWFEESGHEPFVDEAAKFNALMTELVRPVALAAESRP